MSFSNSAECLRKADTAYQIAQVKYKHSQKLSLFERLIYGSEYREELLDSALENIKIAIHFYKLINCHNKYLASLDFKVALEQEMDMVDQYYTLLEIAKCHSDSYNEELTLHYYQQALNYCLESDTSKIFHVCEKMIEIYNRTREKEKVINLYHNILDKYGHVIKDYEVERVSKHLADYYFAKKDYHMAIQYYDKCADIIMAQKLGHLFGEKILLRCILSYIANDDFVGAEKKYNDCCSLSTEFKDSACSSFIAKVLVAVEKTDTAYFLAILHSSDIVYKLSEAEIYAFDEIEKIYFNQEASLQ